MSKDLTEEQQGREAVAIIDADTIAFRYAAGCEKRSVLVRYLPTGSEKEFDNRTAFKDFLNSKGMPYKEHLYSISDVQQVYSIHNAQRAIDALLKRITQHLRASEVFLFLGGGDSFRNALQLPKPYKAGRSDIIKPVHLKTLREYLVKEHSAVDYTGTGIEADDALTMQAYDSLSKGKYPVICTIDKDAWQSQGCAFMDWTAEEFKVQHMPELGSLNKTKQGIKGTGLMFLCYQVLAGDAADTYKPYELSSLYYGPSTAYNAIKDCKSPPALLKTVLQEYKRLYPAPILYKDHMGGACTKDYKEMLRMYWRTAYMLRHAEDEGSADEFFMKYGVNIAEE